MPQDATRAVHWYTRAAEAGDATAQFDLSFHYYDGNGVPKDMALAKRWLTLAAETGHARAKEDLGDLALFFSH